MVLRPDEQASLSQIERDKGIRQNIQSGAKTLGALAVSGGTAALGARLAPFFSKYIPAELAMKGISKVSPKIGDFLKKGAAMGLDLEEGMKYVKDALSPGPSAPEQPKENRNIIQQYSPELHEFMDQRVRGGEDPVRAAALALFDKGNNFEPIIRKIEKEHKTNWSQLVQSIYGGGGGPQQAQGQPQQPGPQPNQPQGQGQGSQALMSILQKINQRLGQ